MLAITNATLVLRDHLLPEAVLLIEDGKILDFGEIRTMSIPDNCEILDAKDSFVGPGLVDIHTHTGDCFQFWQDPIPAAQFHLKHGVTTILPASYPRMTKEQYMEMGSNVRSAMAAPGGENIGGLYLEGPYINPKYGSNRAKNPWNNKAILPEDYLPIIEACADITKVWGMGPEQPGILDFVRAVKEANPGIRLAVTHSEATPQQIEELIPYGLCIGTHHTNATGTLEIYPECRGVCVDEAVNYNNSIYAELISDSRGIHVDGYMQRLVRKIKGDDRIILISDRTYADAPNPPGYDHVTDINFDQWGDIAGSKLTLDVASYNYMKHTGASIVDAFKVSSYNPARATGFTDRGEIRKGLKADLCFVDYKMQVSKVILNGNSVD